MSVQPSYNKVRQPKRASYDREAIYHILDAGLVGQVGFIADQRPMVIPMAYARDGDRIYLHGASKTRLVKLGAALPLCVSVTILDGIVAARSAFHHSMNYRSAIVHGQGRSVHDEAEASHALQRITEHLLPGRYGEIRAVTAQEYKATGVVVMDIEAASAKIRSGPPVDDDEDEALGIWGGVIPIATALGRGVPDGWTPEGVAEPGSAALARRKFSE